MLSTVLIEFANQSVHWISPEIGLMVLLTGNDAVKIFKHVFSYMFLQKIPRNNTAIILYFDIEIRHRAEMKTTLM